MRGHRRTLPRLATLAALAMAGACNWDPRPAAPALEARRVLAGQPPGSLHSFTADGEGIFLRNDAELRLLSLADGRLELIAPDAISFKEAPALAASGRPPPVLAYHLTPTPGQPRRLTVFHREGMGAQQIEGYGFVALPGRMVVVRAPASGSPLWMGPPAALAPGPSPLLEIAAIGPALVPGSAVLAVGRATAGEPAALYEIDLDVGTARLVAPAKPGPIARRPVGLPPPPQLEPAERVGVMAFERICWRDEAAQERCLIAVHRGVGAAIVQPFFDTSGARNPSVANAIGTYLILPEGGEVYLGNAWDLQVASNVPFLGWSPFGTGDQLDTWNLATDRVKSCQVPSTVAVARPWSRGFALIERQPQRDQLLAVESDDRPACLSVPSATGVEAFAVSPDTRVMAWSSVEQQLRGDVVHSVGTLWTSDETGGAVRPLSQGPLLEPLAFDGERRLVYRQYARDGVGLGWLDVESQPVREHPLAEHVVGDPQLLGQGWLLQIVDQRAEDGTGTLSLIDLDSERAFPIATRVSRLFGAGGGQRASAAELISIVYQVMESGDSGGLWLLRVRAGDLRR